MEVLPELRIDKLKEEIGWLKVVFAISLATDISLVAWVIQNYKGIGILAVFGMLGAFLLGVVIIWINRIAYRKIHELEDL